jgi:hypothetical protein
MAATLRCSWQVVRHDLNLTVAVQTWILPSEYCLCLVGVEYGLIKEHTLISQWKMRGMRHVEAGLCSCGDARSK